MQANKTIAFDMRVLVDTYDPTKELAMKFLIKILKRAGHTIWVWTDKDRDYADKTIKDLEVSSYVDKYGNREDFDVLPDIVIDCDAGTDAKEVTIKV